MDNKIILIVLYFGKFPDWFNYWLKSCEFNTQIDWLLFTNDRTEYIYPKNVKRVITTSSHIKSEIQKCFNFNIELSNPYKLCDFRPAYGYIFNEYIKDYTHWGHCDIDLIFGDLKKYLKNDILDNNDRIFNHGHLTIYKNNEKVNEYFKYCSRKVDYVKAFTEVNHIGFDEGKGIREIFLYNCLPQYIKRHFVDIHPAYKSFKVIELENYKRQLFYWEDGKVFREYIDNSNQLIKEEYIYIHFQKKNLTISSEERVVPNSFFISPEGFYEKANSEISEGDFTQYNKKYIVSDIIYYLKYQKLRIKNKIKSYS